MAKQQVIVTGQDRLERHLKKLSNVAWIFDNDIKFVATKSARILKEKNPKDSGETAKKWTNPKKVKDSVYLVQNTAGTQDKKHNVAWINNKGRKAVTPRKAKALYIPLTKKAKRKKLGAKIPKAWVFGTDYVFAKFSKAVKGTLFIDKEAVRAAKEITVMILKKVRKIHGSRR